MLSQLKDQYTLIFLWKNPFTSFSHQKDLVVRASETAKKASTKKSQIRSIKMEGVQAYPCCCGNALPDTLNAKSISVLAHDPRVVVLHEITSNLHHNNFIAHIDRVILPIEKQKNSQEIFQSLAPDLLITMGGMVVSKKIKSLLRSYKGVSHYHVGADRPLDTYYLGVQHLKVDPNSFFSDLPLHLTPKRTIKTSGFNCLDKREVAHKVFLQMRHSVIYWFLIKSCV